MLAYSGSRPQHEHLGGVELVHIGSTAVQDLRGKPMIDAVAIAVPKNLRDVQGEFERVGFHRRRVPVDKDEKPYVCAAVAQAGRRFNVNVHVCHRGDPVHKDSLAFMDILARRPDLRQKYAKAKDRAHAIAPVDSQVYNEEKAAVIREIESLISADRSKSAAGCSRGCEPSMNACIEPTAERLEQGAGRSRPATGGHELSRDHLPYRFARRQT